MNSICLLQLILFFFLLYFVIRDTFIYVRLFIHEINKRRIKINKISRIREIGIYEICYIYCGCNCVLA